MPASVQNAAAGDTMAVGTLALGTVAVGTVAMRRQQMPGLVGPVADEKQALVSYLRQQRQAVRNAVHGIGDDQARIAPTAGSLSLGGLVKHLTRTEHGWVDTMLQQHSDEPDYLAGFVMGPDETLEQLLLDYAQVAARTEAVVAGIEDLGQPVPVPHGVPWFPDDVSHWSVRWVLLHLIEETARHAGHADIVRESLDGATAFPLMAAVEGWPPSPWMRPWQPNPAVAGS